MSVKMYVAIFEENRIIEREVIRFTDKKYFYPDIIGDERNASRYNAKRAYCETFHDAKFQLTQYWGNEFRNVRIAYHHAYKQMRLAGMIKDSA